MELDMEMDEGQPQGCPFFGGTGATILERVRCRSEPGGRPAAGRGCAKEKFLYYIVVPGLAILHEIGDGDAV